MPPHVENMVNHRQKNENRRGLQENPLEAQDPPLDKLFDKTYLRQPMTTKQWIIFGLYTPFGIVLAVLRVLLTIIVCTTAIVTEKYSPWKISDRMVFRLICWITWVSVDIIEGKAPTEEELAHSFIVSNHTMTGDPGVLYPLYHRNAKVVHKSNVGSFDIITRHKILVGGDKNEVKEQILHSIEKDPTPVVIYPEGATTNGQIGLLRFSSFIFSLDKTIHPIGVNYEYGLPFLALHTLVPSYTLNMFVVAFMPYMNAKVHILPPQNRLPTETPEEFAHRVQLLLAKSLNVIPTSYSAQDKAVLRSQLSKKKHN